MTRCSGVSGCIPTQSVGTRGQDTLKVSCQTKSILDHRKKPYENRPQNFKNLVGIVMLSSAIESIETIIVDLPTIRPHKLAMHTMQNQTLVIIRLRCADGIEGIGESTTIGGLSYGGESPDSIKTNIDQHFTPLLIGQDSSNINAAMLRLERSIKGQPRAPCAVPPCTVRLCEEARRDRRLER